MISVNFSINRMFSSGVLLLGGSLLISLINISKSFMKLGPFSWRSLSSENEYSETISGYFPGLNILNLLIIMNLILQ